MNDMKSVFDGTYIVWGGVGGFRELQKHCICMCVCMGCMCDGRCYVGGIGRRLVGHNGVPECAVASCGFSVR